MSNLLQLLPKVFQPCSDVEIFKHGWIASVHNELERRADCGRLLLRNPSLLPAIRAACKRDVLFFIANFGWGYDPRTPDMSRYPLLLWNSQKIYAWSLADPFSGRLLVEKSRDQGAGVIFAHCAVWGWAFHQGYDWGALTRVGKDLDDGTYNSLFGKIDWLLEDIPQFLVPPGTWERRRGHNPTFKNFLTNAIIKGGATTSGTLRGHRYRKVFVDEAAHIYCLEKMMPSLQGLTSNLALASSVNGMGNVFAKIKHAQDGYISQPIGSPSALKGSWNVVRMHWHDDPRKGGDWEAEQRRGMDSIDFDQEFDIKYSTTTRWRVLHELDIDRCTYTDQEWQVLWDQFGWQAKSLVAWDFGSGTSLTGYSKAIYFKSTDTLIFCNYNAWRERPVDVIAYEYGRDGFYCRSNENGRRPSVLIGDNSGNNRESTQDSWISNLEGQGIKIDGRVIWHFGRATQMFNQKLRENKIWFAPQVNVRRNNALPSLGESLSSWRYKVTGAGDDARTTGKADKNIFSHLADTALYIVNEVWGDAQIEVKAMPTNYPTMSTR